jgi:hypothetical protein
MRFRDSEVLSEANWLQRVREALQAQPDAPYRWRTAPRTLPLEGGGQGGGESVERDPSGTEEHDENSDTEAPLPPPPPPPPPTPSPSRGGG